MLRPLLTFVQPMAVVASAALALSTIFTPTTVAQVVPQPEIVGDGDAASALDVQVVNPTMGADNSQRVKLVFHNKKAVVYNLTVGPSPLAGIPDNTPFLPVMANQDLAFDTVVVPLQTQEWIQASKVGLDSSTTEKLLLLDLLTVAEVAISGQYPPTPDTINTFLKEGVGGLVLDQAVEDLHNSGVDLASALDKVSQSPPDWTGATQDVLAAMQDAPEAFAQFATEIGWKGALTDAGNVSAAMDKVGVGQFVNSLSFFKDILFAPDVVTFHLNYTSSAQPTPIPSLQPQPQPGPPPQSAGPPRAPQSTPADHTGHTVAGALSASTPRLRYQMDGKQGQELDIYVTRTSGVVFKPKLHLYDPEGHEVAYSGDIYGGPDASLQVKLASTGTYVLQVEAWEGPGPFSLWWSTGTSGRLYFGSAVDSSIDHPAQRDHYLLDGTQGDSVHVLVHRTSGIQLQPRLHLYDPTDAEEGYSGDIYGGPDATIDSVLHSTGTYTLVIDSWHGTTGPYELTATRASPTASNPGSPGDNSAPQSSAALTLSQSAISAQLMPLLDMPELDCCVFNYAELTGGDLATWLSAEPNTSNIASSIRLQRLYYWSVGNQEGWPNPYLNVYVFTAEFSAADLYNLYATRGPLTGGGCSNARNMPVSASIATTAYHVGAGCPMKSPEASNNVEEYGVLAGSTFIRAVGNRATGPTADAVAAALYGLAR